MKTRTQNFILLVFLSLISSSVLATSYTWTGSISTDWNSSGNWSPSGVPNGISDNVTIPSTSRDPLLDQDRIIGNLTISTDSLDLGTHTLTINGTGTFTSGLITNGLLTCRGSVTAFNGTLIDAEVDAVGGVVRFSGSTFTKKVSAEANGASTSTGTGGCTFNDSLKLKLSSNGVYLKMATSSGNTFQGPVIITNTGDHEIMMSDAGTSYYNNNLVINSTSTGGVIFGNNGGASELSSGKTISIGSTGFTNNYLTLKNFTQVGSTSQSLTLTSSGVLSLTGCTFHGNLTVNGPGFLLKNNTFNGTTSFTKTSSTNYHSDGGNTFNGNVTFSNTGSAGRIRLSTTTGNDYEANATFESTGQSVEVSYSGNSTFKGDVSINNSSINFNAGTSSYSIFNGSSDQTISGSTAVNFKSLSLIKTGGKLILNTPVNIDFVITLVTGNIVTTSTNILTLKNGGYVSGGSSNSFVNGPMKKTGNERFIFPVGKGTHYRTIEISAPSTTTSEFTAEYFDTTQTLGSTMDTTITFVSDCGYWKLDRNSGTSNVNLRFAWSSTACDYLTVKPVHISLWNGTKWTDKGEAEDTLGLKKTNANQSTFGYFALAYDLEDGDAPQHPYPLTVSTGCSAAELLFNNKEIWFSFKPDSALIKIGLLTTDTSKVYAPISNSAIYNNYIAGENPIFVKDWDLNCDSLLQFQKTFSTDLDTSKSYLLKLTRYQTGDCDGIHDTINYFVNVCIKDLRMLINPTILYYQNLSDLVHWLGVNGAFGAANWGDVVAPSGDHLVIDLTSLTQPLIVETGITFTGNYDLLSEPFTLWANLNSVSINPTPTGTLLTCSRRGTVNSGELNDEGYMLYMLPESVVRNIRLKGAMPGFQDYNQDTHLCAGIRADNFDPNTFLGTFNILNSEIYNFSYAGIFSSNSTANINISNCEIHHIRGGGGQTTAKGYGVWTQGTDSQGKQLAITNSIFDDCKAATDMQGYEINYNFQYCTIGETFFQEAINKHNKGTNFDASNSNRTCTDFYDGGSLKNINSDVLNDLAKGNIFLLNSIFHKKKQVITLPYPGGDGTFFQVKLNNNTYVATQDAPSNFPNNYGGYARILDNYIKVCVWDWERMYNVSKVHVTNTADAILEEVGNTFDYHPGMSVSSSPQPPEFDFEFSNVDGFVPDFKPLAPKVPYISENNADLQLDVTKGIYGASNQSYVIRAKTSLINSPSLLNGYNSYEANQIVTSAQSGSYSHTYDDTDFWNNGSKNPGLYGVDIMAVDASTSSHRFASKWIHQPIIVAPTDNYKFIFNIKDSFYEDLYGVTSTLGDNLVFKQVELNGNVIWREDIKDGGDDWERVELDLKNDQYQGTNIRNYLNTNGFKNVLTFSIGMDDPSQIATDLLRGLMVWVDDIYLKHFATADNLCRDGDVENSGAYELKKAPDAECMFYKKFSVNMEPLCFSLDDSYDKNNYPNSHPTTIASTSAFLAQTDRKSGIQSLLLKLDGIHNDVNLQDCLVYAVNGPLSPSNALISAGFDFDIRDFYDCSDVASLLGYTTSSTLPSSPISNSKLLITASNTISTYYTISGSDLIFETNTPPLSLTVANGGTLEITGNLSDSTYLGGCDHMWEGIIVEPGGHLIITGTDGTATNNDTKRYVTIADAYNAISTDGNGITTGQPEIDITHVNFFKNQLGIKLENDNYASSAIKGCLFSCDNGYITKDPVNPIIFPEEHILYEDVNDAPDILHLSGRMTEFTDIKYGIKAIRSDVKSGICEFRDLMENADPQLKGIGIFAQNNTANVKSLQVTSRFDNLKNGVLIKGNFDVDISDADFYRDISDAAISINNVGYENSISISDVANFNNCNIGIKIISSGIGSIDINNNIFSDYDFTATSNRAFHGTAITIQRPISSSRSVLNCAVRNNTITDYRIGIHARNITGIKIGSQQADNSNIQSNIITFSKTSETYPNRGIWIQNCYGAELNDNEISDYNLATPHSFAAIEMGDISGGRLRRNLLTGIGTDGGNGILIRNPCYATYLECNQFSHFTTGIYLVGGDLPQQGTFDPNDPFGGEGWENIWDSNIDVNSRVIGTLNVSSNAIPWYHTGTNTSDYSPAPSATQVVRPFSDQTNHLDCDNPPSPLRIIDRDLELGPFIADTLSFSENQDESRYFARKRIYELLKEDTTILSTGRTSDSSFTAFFVSLLNSNIDSLTLPDNLDGLSLDSLYALNDAINDTLQMESYLKQINAIYLNSLITGDDYTSTDTTALIDIGSQLTALGGTAVYDSWAMLFEEVHEEIPELRAMSMIQESPVSSSIIPTHEFLVFPNPTNRFINVSIKGDYKLLKLELFDLIGKKILEKENPVFPINVEWMEEGTYLIRIVDSENNLMMTKLIKLK